MLDQFKNPSRLLVLCLGLIVSSLAMADEQGDEDRVDEIHDDWSEWVLETANRVDGFFSNSQPAEVDQQTRLRAFVRVRYDGNEGTKLSPGVRARISLPKTENRLKLILGDDEEESRIHDLDESQQNISLQLRGKTQDRPEADSIRSRSPPSGWKLPALCPGSAEQNIQDRRPVGASTDKLFLLLHQKQIRVSRPGRL